MGRKALLKNRSRKAASEIIAVLALIFITVAVSALVFAYGAGATGAIGQGSNVLSNMGSALQEQLDIEQTVFNYSSSSASLSYVLLTFSNSQSNPTAAPFQQLLTINPSLYTSLEAADLGNLRFFSTLTGNSFSNPVNSWLEAVSSTPANAATSATFWLGLPSGVGGSSSTNVYMVFQSSSTEFDGNVAGEAPQLSASFAQYDNGANVFTYYNNGGSQASLNVVNGGTLSVTAQTNPYGSSSSVLTLTGPGSTSSSSETVAWIANAVAGNNFISEGWININSNLNGLFAVRGASSATTTNYLLGDGWTGAESTVVYESGTTNNLLSGAGSRTATWLWDQATVTGNTFNTSIYSNPPYLGGSKSSSTSTTDSTLGAGNQYLGIATWSGSTSPAYFFGWRVRAYPPNGVMPSTSTGSLVSGSTSSRAGAALYIRNIGLFPVTVASVYVQNLSANSFVSSYQLPSARRILPSTMQIIPISFNPIKGTAYSVTIVSLSGSAFTTVALA